MHGAQQRRLRIPAIAVYAVFTITACSTVDRTPGDECREDSDCDADQICSLAQGNICVPEELPPIAAIGFEIRDDQLRVELTGCDPEVTLELGGSELRVQKRSALVEDFNLVASTRRSVLNCGGNECTGVCDEDTLTCIEPAAVEFSLTSASRLGLGDINDKQPYVIEPPEGELVKPAAFTWPSYEAAEPGAALVLEAKPSTMGSNSSYRRVLADDAPAEIDSVSELRCQRGLYGGENAVQTVVGTPIIGATVEFRYAEAIAAPSSVIGTAPSCDTDVDCPTSWACNDQAGTCGLNLMQVAAGSTISTEELLGGFAPAWVYTYCEGMLAPIDPIYREFEVTVTPPAESGLPTVLYALDQPFVDNPTRWAQVQGKLCLPDWQPPQPVGFSITGDPVTLTESELGEYACCSTECLPSAEVGVEPTPPPIVESCSAFSNARFETRWSNTDPELWVFADCVPTAAYPDGSNGGFAAKGACEDGTCSVGLTPGHTDDPSRLYTITISQDEKSVFRSQRITRQIDPETTELEPFKLLPRVLLRGQVSCVTDTKCVATNAVVWAERLRVDTDETEPPGPFFFEARVDVDGNFVLPVDPGVYVVTAFPAVGQLGGPAPFFVVDLREDSEEIETVDGVPNAALAKPLELDDGILVRVALDGFPLSTGVTPLDMGSWKSQADFPAELDLNDPQTCYSSELGKRRGCAIRRLRPTDATISLLISERIQFTARSRGSDECE
jgi:hypothetical protein